MLVFFGQAQTHTMSLTLVVTLLLLNAPLPHANSRLPANCNYDRRCFIGSGRAAICLASPFRRFPAQTCNECLNECRTFLTSTTGLRCRTAIFNHAFRSCDLFAVSPDRRFYPMVRDRNRDLFIPTFQPGCELGTTTPAPIATTETPVPTAATCPAGQVVRFLSIRDTALVGARNTQSVSGLSREQCIRLCKDNKNPSTNEIVPCRSVTYNRGSCVVSMAVLPPRGSARTTSTTGSEYLEKFCFPAESVRNCGEVFEMVPGFLLVGFARQPIRVQSFAECLNQCILASANFGFGCASGMYYKSARANEDNCILNSESRENHPDLFTPQEPGEDVDYFQPDCGARRIFIDSDMVDLDRINFLQDANPQQAGKWTPWSSCNLSSAKEVRYRLCSSPDVRKCKSQHRDCEMYHIPKNICNCLMDETGVKNCNFGLKLIEDNGKLKYETCKPK